MQNYQTINELFNCVCNQHKYSIAFSCLGKSMTYGELNRHSADFAAYLQHHTTLAPGDRLVVQLPNLLQYPVVVFGALRVGVVIVNTNPLYTGRELKHQLIDSGAKVMVVLANLAKAAESVIDKTQIQHVIITEVGDMHGFPKRQLINSVLRYIKKQVPAVNFASSTSLLQALSLGSRDTFTAVHRAPEDVAFLQYTGGTTGVAKGAMLSQANLLANKSQAIEHWGDSLKEGKEVFLAPLPLYHIYGFTMHCMVLFSLGAESVLVPNPRELKSVVDAFKKNTLTGMVGLNTLFVALARNQDFRELDFSSLEKTVSGGMALTNDTANIWEKLTGSCIVEGYGLTETSPIVTSNDPKLPRKNTIGVALPNTELKVINDDGESLPSGEAGELCVRGPQVMLGYWLQTEATADVLTSEGWLRTGDIAVIENDGYVRIVDRKKDMIIVSGFNVYPNEVENILVAHSDIVEAAVIGVPDDVSGEVVKAFIVKVEGSKLDFEAIRAFCQLSLTSYKIPRLYEFRDTLPKTNVGKVLRRELRDAEGDDV